MGDWDWGYSLDQEQYHAGGETREEAIRRGIASSVMRESKQIWVCELRPIGWSEVMPSATIIIEEAIVSAGDNYGCEDWPDPGPEAVAELDSFLNAWMEKHDKGSKWYTTDGYTPELVPI